MKIVEATAVSKTYGDVTALADLSVSVEAGSTFGLLGTNGAGKTTLFKLLVGHIVPDAGTVAVAGTDVADAGSDIRSLVGYLPEHVGFPALLTGREVLRFHARMHGSPPAEREDRIDEVLATVGLTDAADRVVDGYSNGMQQRLGLASALLPHPRLLLLDEPTAGLDPLGVAEFHRIIERLRADSGLTVVLSSHVMAEVEALCDTVAILHEGRLLAADDLRSLKQRAGGEVTLRGRVPADAMETAVDVVSERGGRVRSSADGTLVVETAYDRVTALLAALEDAVDFDRFEVREVGLDRVFEAAIEEATAERETPPAARSPGGPVVTDPTRPESDGGVATATGAVHPVAPGDADHLRQVLVLAMQEYRLSIRNRWAFALTGLFVVFAGFLAALAGSRVGPAGYEVMLVSLAALATYLLPLAALVFGYDAVVGAAEEGWLDVVFALPVPRPLVVLGSFLGRAVTLVAATVVGFGLAGGLVFLQLGYVDWVSYTLFLVSAAGVGLAFLSLGVLISTVAAEKTHALGLSLGAWVWFVLVHDLLALAAVAAFDLPGSALSALMLLNPADIFRVIVLGSVDATGSGFAAVFDGTGLTLPVLVVALLGWGVVPLAVAGRAVTRRSL